MWKQVHNAVKDHQAHGLARDFKGEVWKSLDKLFVFCDKATLSKNDQQAFENEVNNFGDTMKEASTACNITHYMVPTLPCHHRCIFFAMYIFSS